MPEFDLSPVLRFAADLKLNNNHPWFMEYKADLKLARACFEDFISGLILVLCNTEPLGDNTPKDHIFRVNRDLRFLKKTHPVNSALACISPWRK